MRLRSCVTLTVRGSAARLVSCSCSDRRAAGGDQLLAVRPHCVACQNVTSTWDRLERTARAGELPLGKIAKKQKKIRKLPTNVRWLHCG